MRKLINFLFLCVLLFYLLACWAETPQQTIYKVPYFTDTLPYPTRNPFTIKGIALGKQLFFDENLSANGQIACATCHLPRFAFADTMPLTDKGLSKQKLSRNTPTLLNLAWANQGLFWDGGARDLESLMFAPIAHANEMGQNLNELPSKLKQKQGYQNLFKQAFQKDTITNTLIARALAQYVRTLVADSSLYDDFMRKKTQLTGLEEKGQEIFNQQCQSCHLPPFFTDFGFHQIQKSKNITFTNNPLEDFSSGRFRITGDSADIGKFKTPTLRNLKLTAPYLHNGSAKTIGEAIQTHENIKIPTTKMDFLLAFLNTLNEQ